MLNEMKTVKNAIQFLQDRKDEVEDVQVWGYEVAIQFLNDYVSDVEDDLEYEYSEKYHTSDNYYNF
jgi:hypothetical protein